MSQSLLPPVCLEDVASISRVLLVLFRRADLLGSERHHSGLGTKGARICLLPPRNLEPAMNVRACPVPFVLHQESTSFENSSSKGILYHGHPQVTWTCSPVSTGPLKYKTSISSRSSALKLRPAHLRGTLPLPPLLMKLVFIHVLWQCCLRRWGRTPAGLFPCSVFWCYYHWCLVMQLPLSHDGRWLCLALAAMDETTYLGRED